MLIRQRLAAGVIVLAGWIAASPAPALNVDLDRQPVTKWLQGERHPAVGSSTPLLLPADALTTPGLVGPAPVAVVAPTVTVASRLGSDKREYRLGEPVHLYVELSWEGRGDEVLPEAPEEPLLKNLEKRSGGMVQSSSVRRDSTPPRVVVTYHYVFDPVAIGPASIEPITVYYRIRGSEEQRQLTTERYALTFLARPLPWGKIAGGTIAVLAAVAGLVAAGLALKERSRRARETAQAPPPPSPYDRLQSEIEPIQRLFTEGAVREAYDAIDRLVRQAIGQRLETDVRTVTIDELIERIDGNPVDAEVRDRTSSILNRCGDVKFAGYAPTVADQNQIVADCRLLLDGLEEESAREPDENSGGGESRANGDH